jgi:hypothetical protein
MSATDPALLLLNTLQEALVRRLLLVVLIEEQRSTLTRKHPRNPRVLIRNAPNSHANAPLDRQARLRNALVSRRLHSELLRCRRRVQSQIQLGVRDIDAQVRRSTKSGRESFSAWGRAGRRRRSLGGEMGLVADAVDLEAVRLDELDDADGASRLVAVVLEVVVVVEELAAGVLGGEAEGDGDEGFADGVVPDALAVGAVFFQGCGDDDLVDCQDVCSMGVWRTFVHNIPLRALSLVSSCNGLDVVFHDGDQRLVVKVAVRYPSGELAVPHQVVAANLYAVLMRVVDITVTVLEREVVAARLSRLPLLRVLGGDAVGGQPLLFEYIETEVTDELKSC